MFSGAGWSLEWHSRGNTTSEDEISGAAVDTKTPLLDKNAEQSGSRSRKMLGTFTLVRDVLLSFCFGLQCVFLIYFHLRLA